MRALCCLLIAFPTLAQGYCLDMAETAYMAAQLRDKGVTLQEWREVSGSESAEPMLNVVYSARHLSPVELHRAVLLECERYEARNE